MDIPWVQLVWEKHYRNGKLPNHVKKGSYWWRDILKLLDTFKGIAKVDLKSGSSCFFWFDMWNDHIPSLTYPELFSFSKNKAITFQKVASSVPLHQLFHLPLSEIAFAQLLSLEQVIQRVALTHEPDSRTYIWGSNFYSSTRAYKQLTGHSQVHPAFKCLWNFSYQNKHKVFCWLLLKDILSTRNIPRRKSMILDTM